MLNMLTSHRVIFCLSILRSVRLMFTSLMNKTIIALALSSVYTPLIPVSRTQLGFSLSFAGLKMSKFFSSFIYSNVAYREINIRNSDFGFFLSTVVNLDSANHNILNQDMTDTYNKNNMMAWVTCPLLTCKGTVFHDITSNGMAAGAIAYQGATNGLIEDSTFTKIRANVVEGGAGGIICREYFGSTGKANTKVNRCCFTDIRAFIEDRTENSAFNLAATSGVEIDKVIVYNCGDDRASYNAVIASSETGTTVSNFNSSFNRGSNYGLGLTIYTNNNGDNSISHIKFSTFSDIQSGSVIFASGTRVAGGNDFVSEFKHKIEMSTFQT